MPEGENLGIAYAGISIDSEQTSRGLNKTKGLFNATLDELGSKLDQLGQRMGDIGQNLTMITAPLAIALGASVAQAVKFEEQMANINSVMKYTPEKLAEISAEILAIGESSRAGPQAVAQSFYDIVGGIDDADSHLAILNASIATAEAGNADLAGVTSALVSVMNSYTFGAEKAGFASDTLTQVVNKGVGTMDELAASLPQVAGLANSMGIEFDDLGAGMAWLTKKGNSFSQAATQMRAMMTAMLNPNDSMKKGLQELGFESGQAAVDALGLVGAYEALNGTQVASTEGMAKMTGSVEALSGAIALTGEGAAEFLDNFSNGLDGATEAARKLQLESTAAEIDKAKAALEGLAITVGTLLLPFLGDLARVFQQVVSKVSAWIKENPQLAATLAKIAVVVVALGPALMIAGKAISAIGAIMALVASPIGLIIAAVAALALAFETNFMGIRDVVQPILDRITTGFSEVWRIMQAFAGWVGEQGLVGALQTLFATFEDGSNYLGAIFEAFGMGEEQAYALGTAIGDMFGGMVTFIQTTVLPVIQQFFGFIASAWETIQPGLVALFNWFTTEALPAVVGFVLRTVIPGIQAFISTLLDIWNIVQPALIKLFDWFVVTALPAILSFITDVALPAVQGLIDTLIKVWNDVSPFLIKLFDWFVTVGLPLIVAFISEVVVPVVQSFIDILVSIWDAVSPILTKLYEWFMTTALPAIVAFVEGPVTTAIQGLINILSGIWTAVQPGVDNLKLGIEAAFAVISKIVDGVVGTINGIGKAVTDALTAIGLLNGQKVGVEGVDPGTGVTNPATLFGTTGFASGGWTGSGGANEPAGVVHKGEWVVPQNGALVMRESGGSSGMNFDAGSIVINASTFEGGKAAARGFSEELEERRRSRG